MPLQVAASAGKPAPVPTPVLKRFPHLAGCTPLLLPDNILRQVGPVAVGSRPVRKASACVVCAFLSPSSAAPAERLAVLAWMLFGLLP